MLYAAKIIEEMPAYKRLVQDFQKKGYTIGNADYDYYEADMPITSIPENERYEYLRQHLSGCHDDYIEYVMIHSGQFGKQFFKDLIEINFYSLCFEKNIFEWMDGRIIDEELVMCAMQRAVDMRYCDRRDECDDWFYSVQKRKPELLTQEMFILGARCFASKRHGVNRFLEITPPKYCTEEYYYALCIHNDTPVMEDIPKEILSDSFLISILNDDIKSIRCFTEAELEREVPVENRGTLKIWQAVMAIDGCNAELIPLNEDRIKYFFSLYDKDSREYEFSFKYHYKEYLRKKNNNPSPGNKDAMLAGIATLLDVMSGVDNDEAIDRASKVMHETTDRKTRLPIYYRGQVPPAFSKKLDTEEYLLEIYKKLGIEILGEADYYFYDVKLPKDITVITKKYGNYYVKKGNKTVVSYFDRGSFYDRDVVVDEIFVSL